jgi:tyrosine-protein phosphatase YwqE
MTLDKAEEMRNRGVLLQINIPSIIGYYSYPIQRMAIKLIEKGWVDLLGSDCHNQHYMNLLETAIQNKYYRKAVDLPLLNNSL